MPRESVKLIIIVTIGIALGWLLLNADWSWATRPRNPWTSVRSSLEAHNGRFYHAFASNDAATSYREREAILSECREPLWLDSATPPSADEIAVRDICKSYGVSISTIRLTPTPGPAPTSEHP